MREADPKVCLPCLFAGLTYREGAHRRAMHPLIEANIMFYYKAVWHPDLTSEGCRMTGGV